MGNIKIIDVSEMSSTTCEMEALPVNSMCIIFISELVSGKENVRRDGILWI